MTWLLASGSSRRFGVRLPVGFQHVDDFSGKIDRQRHVTMGLGSGKTEHHPLVAGPQITAVAVFRHSGSNLGRLFMELVEDLALVDVEAGFLAVIADAPEGRFDDVVDVRPALGMDLASDQDEVLGYRHFAGNTRIRIALQICV